MYRFIATLSTMKYFQKLKKYYQHNPEGYWFKRKLYGWGWTPVTWQGWVVTVGYVGLVLLFTLTVDTSSTMQDTMFTFLLPVTFLTITFFRIARRKGEKPRWQWGIPDTEELRDRE